VQHHLARWKCLVVIVSNHISLRVGYYSCFKGNLAPACLLCQYLELVVRVLLSYVEDPISISTVHCFPIGSVRDDTSIKSYGVRIGYYSYLKTRYSYVLKLPRIGSTNTAKVLVRSYQYLGGHYSAQIHRWRPLQTSESTRSRQGYITTWKSRPRHRYMEL
jgi:hypothetical protein